MKTRRSMGAIAVGTVLFLLTFAGASFAQDTLKVGAMFSQTGAGSAVGKIQVEAVKLAVKEVNDKGGVTMGGKKMRLEKIDYPKDETADGDKKKPIKEKKTSHAKVISLSNLKKE